MDIIKAWVSTRTETVFTRKGFRFFSCRDSKFQNMMLSESDEIIDT